MTSPASVIFTHKYFRSFTKSEKISVCVLAVVVFLLTFVAQDADVVVHLVQVLVVQQVHSGKKHLWTFNRRKSGFSVSLVRSASKGPAFNFKHSENNKFNPTSSRT